MSTKGSEQFQRYKIIGIILLIVIAFMALTGAFKSGNSMKDSGDIKSDYKSIQDLIKNSSINLDLPSYVINQQDIKINSFMGSLIEMGNENFVLKAANFIDTKADPLGLYDIASNDISFTSEENVNYVRIRTGYPGYSNCTLINWCTNTTSYGMMIQGIYDEDEVFNLIELNKYAYTLQIKEDALTEESIENVSINYIAIAGKYGIGLPVIKSSINLYDYDGYTIAYIDKTSCFILVYNDYDIDNKTFDQQESILLDDGVVLYYKAENPFEIGSVAYGDYSNILNTINNNLVNLKYLD